MTKFQFFCINTIILSIQNDLQCFTERLRFLLLFLNYIFIRAHTFIEIIFNLDSKIISKCFVLLLNVI